MKGIVSFLFFTVLFISCSNKITPKTSDDDATGNTDNSVVNDEFFQDLENVDETVNDNDETFSVPDEDVTHGCSKSSECGEGYFCKKADGACTSQGVCEKAPVDCDYEVDEPFCGCDMQSYRNRCFANNYGINIKSKGLCPNLEKCTKDEDCPENTFCDHFYDTCEGDGICKEKPLECQEYEFIVCGCDGNTHENMCYAQMSGTGIMHPGGCGSMDECHKNSDCLETEYCSKKEGVCDENAAGQCDLKRDEQECLMYSAIIYVCGCDKVTYQHPCFASNAGTTIAHEGECK
ncbi:MAG TPA: hypothetical protein PL195_09905 [bacterium]|nr:hypothetical protein [bacterium]HQJ59561.1 hypothetical protein [bacterium]